MEVIQSSLVILGANTVDPTVMWNGILVPVEAGSITWDSTKRSVTLTIKEDPIAAEMKAAGIQIRRV